VPAGTTTTPLWRPAERAGHSVAILLKIYAKCVDGQDAIAKRRIEDALGDPGDDAPHEGGNAQN
jgi:hypothetical protein